VFNTELFTLKNIAIIGGLGILALFLFKKFIDKDDK